MRIYKGIVCEINKKYMIFMTSDGEFLRGVPLNSNPQIGDEVPFQLMTIPFSEKKRVKTYIIGPVLVAAILLIFLGTSLFTDTKSAYAYVKLGEELELSIDEQGNVIAVNNLKENNNLRFDELEGLPIETALSKAVSKIAPNNQDITISTKYNDEKPSSSKEKIENAIDEVQNIKNNNTNKTDTNTNNQNNNKTNTNVNENQSQKNKVENKDIKENNHSDKHDNKENNPSVNQKNPSTNSNNGNEKNGNNANDKDKQQNENPNASNQNNNNNRKEQTNMNNRSHKSLKEANQN